MADESAARPPLRVEPSFTNPEDCDLELFDEVHLPTYQYSSFPSDTKRIRLLSLDSGDVNGAKIFCNLIEADYDNPFHIPTKHPSPSDHRPYHPRGGGSIASTVSSLVDPIVVPHEPPSRRDREPLSEADCKRYQTFLDELNERKQRKNLTAEVLARSDKSEQDKRLFAVRQHEIRYEALSWCWGTSKPIYALRVHYQEKDVDKTARMPVTKELALALKYLRQPDRARILWIDAICINQSDSKERNHQVQLMSRIYTRATQVAIWLGPHTESSRLAFQFIREELTTLTDIDVICSERRYARKWEALMRLMQTDWFSRRWVVQEVALARDATVYCGRDSVPWRDFAVAVELFVEVETATHRLSEIMQLDEKYRHIPGWFEHVAKLGASLLVQATGKIFGGQGVSSRKITKSRKKRLTEIDDTHLTFTVDPLQRRGLLSLEHLVSTMFIFKSTEPRDVIYALLALARDATPIASLSFGDKDRTDMVMSLFTRLLEEKPFHVDYDRSYSDICRDFVQFAVERKHKIDPIQSLDVLCRPWAFEGPRKKSLRLQASPKATEKTEYRKKPWQGHHVGPFAWKHTTEPPDGFDVYVNILQQYAEREATRPERSKPTQDAQESDDDDHEMIDEDDFDANNDVPLPGWVARTTRAPFSQQPSAGFDVIKVKRANADPLVGEPLDGRRVYRAAQTLALNMEGLRFRKRPLAGHYSLYTDGFKIDEVVKVEDASQGGQIPVKWLELANWRPPYDCEPPDELWRTLVADRGRDGENPPRFYARACSLAVKKGDTLGGSVNPALLIERERNSIVAQFCRRVHAVIWNRHLFRTKAGRLGLAQDVAPGDGIYVLPGCTVPVVLRERVKEPLRVAQETFEDRMEAFKSLYASAVDKYYRKKKYDPRIRAYMAANEWEGMMDARAQANVVLCNNAADRAINRLQEAESEEKRARARMSEAVLRRRNVRNHQQPVDKRRSEADHDTSLAEANRVYDDAESALEAAKERLDECKTMHKVKQEAAAAALEEHKQRDSRRSTAAMSTRLFAATEINLTATTATMRTDISSGAPMAGQEQSFASGGGTDSAPNLSHPQPNRSPSFEQRQGKRTYQAFVTDLPDERIRPEQSNVDSGLGESDFEDNISGGVGTRSELLTSPAMPVTTLQDAATGYGVRSGLSTTRTTPYVPPLEMFGSPVVANMDDFGTFSRAPTFRSPAMVTGAAPEKSRPAKPHYYYEFKGECYLHGMMDGEAPRLKFHEGIPLQSLELR